MLLLDFNIAVVNNTWGARRFRLLLFGDFELCRLSTRRTGVEDGSGEVVFDRLGGALLLCMLLVTNVPCLQSARPGFVCLWYFDGLALT